MKVFAYIAGAAVAVFLGIVMVIVLGAGLVVAWAEGSTPETTTTTTYVSDGSFLGGFRQGYNEEMAK